MASRLQSGPLEHVLSETILHLGVKAPLFLSLLSQLLTTTDTDIDGIIVSIAQLLKDLPATLYRLNSLFHPQARIEFNIRWSPVTSFVLITPNTSRLMFLDSLPENSSPFHNLTATRLCDILTTHAAGDRLYDALYSATDPALRDCLAELALNMLDGPMLSRTCRKEALKFLRHCAGVPPSLLLYELKELEPFYLSAFSDLYLGTLGTLRVVIKKPRILKSQLDRAEILREAVLYRQFRHPNIIPFLGVSCSDRDWLYGLVTPYMKYGNIIEFLKCYPDVNRLTPVWHIVKGLEYLHNCQPPIAHRDIKGSNVLVKDDLVCGLSDFGLSSIPELSQRSREHAVGTAAWMAPEILAPPDHGRLDLLKTDIFALGITILEMYIGQPPFSSGNLVDICLKRVVRKEKPPLPPVSPHYFPPFLTEVVGMMLDYDPSERPDIRLICQGIEDVLTPPPQIVIKVADQQPAAKVQASSTDDEFPRVLAREFIRKEWEHMGKERLPPLQAKDKRARPQLARIVRNVRNRIGPDVIATQIPEGCGMTGLSTGPEGPRRDES